MVCRCKSVLFKFASFKPIIPSLGHLPEEVLKVAGKVGVQECSTKQAAIAKPPETNKMFNNRGLMS